jgi:hypothetical protein
MKKIIVMLAVVGMGFSAAAQAAPKSKKKAESAAPAAEQAPKSSPRKAYSRPYGMAGCGLGSMVVGKRGAQIFAATTNGTFGNQTFGITFGTLNCQDAPNTEVAMRMDHFVAANKGTLAADIAKGDGEAIGSLSSIMGCDSSAQLGVEMQKNFKQIFPSTEVAPNEITDSIISVIRQNDTLAGTCKKIS